MKILAIGDVTSPAGVEYLSRKLWRYREAVGIDLVIVNAENAGFITGAGPLLAEKLLRGGADCLTGGNHTLRNRQVYTYLDQTREMLRPINFGDGVPGRGYTIIDCAGRHVLVISAMGCVHIEPNLDAPYSFIDAVLEKEKGKYDLAVMDIHAEATGEKLAIANFYDGKINVIFGTHTHVITADECVLPGGTGYITDVGMCGESDGILGIEKNTVIESMRMHMPPRFKAAEGEVKCTAALFTIDNLTYKVTDVKRVKI